MTTTYSNKKQSYAGFVKERLDLIEARIELGYRPEAIQEEIEKGTSQKASLSGFRGALNKARKWRDQLKKEGKDVLSIKPPQAVVREEEFLQEKVMSSLIDPRPNISHHQVMAEAQAIIDFENKKLSVSDQKRLEQARIEIDRLIHWIERKIICGVIWRTENALIILGKAEVVFFEHEKLIHIFGFKSFGDDGSNDLCVLDFPSSHSMVGHYGNDILPLINLINFLPKVTHVAETYITNLLVRRDFQILHEQACNDDQSMVAEIKKALLKQ